MPLPRFPRLDAVFGVRLDQLEEQHLVQIIARSAAVPVLEDVDLDFKESLYGPRDEDKRALAQDVAALANTRGGVIMMGIAENNGAASTLRPVALTDAEELRIRNILATLVAPVPLIEMRRIQFAGTPNQGVLLLAVPRSAQAPHAVRVGDNLRYYQRDGNRNRPLSESEVADAYRSRFRDAEAQVSRLEKLQAEGQAQLKLANKVWLTMAVVPNVPGSMALNHRSVLDARRWVDRYRTSNLGDGPFNDQVSVGTGVRRLLLRWGYEQGPAQFAYGELYEDGSGFMAREVWRPRESESSPTIVDEHVVLTASGLLRLLVDHALEHAGVYGDAIIQSSLVAQKGSNGFSPPLRLGHERMWGIREEWTNTRAITSSPISQRTINIELVATNPQERMAGIRLALVDIFQAFGVAEVPQIDHLGRLRSSYWREGVLQSWTGCAGVPVVNATMESADT